MTRAWLWDPTGDVVGNAPDPSLFLGGGAKDAGEEDEKRNAGAEDDAEMEDAGNHPAEGGADDDQNVGENAGPDGGVL